MFLFDWQKICTHAEGKVVNTVRIFRMLVEKQVPKNKWDKIYKYSQIDFVLGKWSAEEEMILNEKIKICSDIILSFCIEGLNKTMSKYNNN